MSKQKNMSKQRKSPIIQVEHEKMMRIINNPKPLKKPPYSCPATLDSKDKDCQYPNCLCQWVL